jgi:hypothetical protein
MAAEHFVRYETDGPVAVITLDRPDAANAQTPGILKDLDDAWRRADADPDVRVIVFTTTGKHFSAGHDMSGIDPSANGRDLRPKRADDGKLVAEYYYDWETRGYLEYAKRWRDIPKPTIAAVQGKCIAAGLMLCWPCDLIVAADNAQFSDPVALMGIMGVEYHAHTWELGPQQGQGDAIYSGFGERRGGIADRDGQPCGAAGEASRIHSAARATDRSHRPMGIADGEARRESHPGHDGFLQLDRVVFRHAPPRPYACARGHRGQNRGDGGPSPDEGRRPP